MPRVLGPHPTAHGARARDNVVSHHSAQSDRHARPHGRRGSQAQRGHQGVCSSPAGIVGAVSNVYRYSNAERHDAADPNHEPRSHGMLVRSHFPADATQSDIYGAVQHLVADVVHGFNATIFAYGQTGTGKTHTILGMDEASSSSLSGRSGTPVDTTRLELDAAWGIIPRALFELVQQFGNNGVMTCAYLQIYNDKIYDLLADRKRQRPLVLREADDVSIQGLSLVPIATMDDVYAFLRKGKLHRVVRETEMNAASSRSHAILQVHLRSRSGLRQGKLNLVDLAGSEKWNKLVVKPGVEIEEMKSINSSLSALGNCIAALTQAGRKHIPYRDSTLTRLLKDSLGGNTRTVLIATINGRASDETVRTIQFADRTRAVMQCVVLNPTPTVSPRQLQLGLVAARAHIAKLRLKVLELSNVKDKQNEEVQSKLAHFEANIQAKERAIGTLLAQNEAYEAKVRESERQIQQLQHKIQALTTPEKVAAKPCEYDWDRLERGRSLSSLAPIPDPPALAPEKSSTLFKSLYSKPGEKVPVKLQPVMPSVLSTIDATIPVSKSILPTVCTDHQLQGCVLCSLRSKAPASNQLSAMTETTKGRPFAATAASLPRKPPEASSSSVLVASSASSGVCAAHQLSRCILCQSARPKLALPPTSAMPTTSVTAATCAPHRLTNCVLCSHAAQPRFAASSSSIPVIARSSVSFSVTPNHSSSVAR
ncbi:hypothetical protein SPRG_01669 [Saprolegnia parasitica CBS 223.65]|uniref:Kinesin-like protein n=1 Tax=Saprolegnia parasitica (strain CBS 223.65) TaxID=695850 RepID=A0A067CX17_SAPPC|nr:hypothetical protein SPRG_01669 [Saprolegnia parasitica CBS 223.65]KDO33790.1 hypothetical protein SPRG_01669 [Saprolegnia parasitica CBS 223.65]|eukprot:XP_012195426.1 hypothetical protein SPRG_01669 [Saprolegnia parasitica CBS 223.65]